MGMCIPCVVNSIRGALRTGVYSWDTLKPELKRICQKAGYDPNNDPKLVEWRARRDLQRRINSTKPHTPIKVAKASIRRVVRERARS